MTHVTSSRPLSLSHFFTNLPEVTTDRLTLRKLEMADVDALYAITSDAEVSKYLSWTPHESPSEAKAFLKKFCDAYRAGNPAPWGIVDRSSGGLIGTCGVIDTHPRHKWAQVSFGVARAHWNKGYATEAVRAAVGTLFERTDIQRIEGLSHAGNGAGRRAMEKAGLTFEGVLRQNMFAKGAFHDLAMYSVVRPEWVGK